MQDLVIRLDYPIENLHRAINPGFPQNATFFIYIKRFPKRMSLKKYHSFALDLNKIIVLTLQFYHFSIVLII